LSGPLAIDSDFYSGEVERLDETDIFKRSDWRITDRIFSAKARSSEKFGPFTSTWMGVGEPKFIILLTISPASK
jgi:hypothetical protein